MTFHKLVDLISDRQQNVYQLLLWIVAKNVYLLGYFLLFQQIETVFCVIKESLNIYISGYILYFVPPLLAKTHISIMSTCLSPW